MAQDKVHKPLCVSGPRIRSQPQSEEKEFSVLHKKFLYEHSGLEKFCATRWNTSEDSHSKDHLENHMALVDATNQNFHIRNMEDERAEKHMKSQATMHC